MVKATKFMLPVLMASIMLLASCVPKQPTNSTTTRVEPPNKGALKTAKLNLESGKYSLARAEASKFIEQNRSSELSGEAQYIIALSYLRQGREDDARKELERLLKNFPIGPNSAEAAATLRTLEARRLQAIAAKRADQQHDLIEKAKQTQKILNAMRLAAAKERVYVVMDLTHNLIMLKMGDATLYSFPCAAGKRGGFLTATSIRRKFTTPVGKFIVERKKEKPVWIRPNWYWLERGEEVPEGITLEQRKVPNKLGEYSIGIGDDVYFHGFIGVVTPGKYTHGCIRVNDDHLEIFYNLVEIGTEVFIF